MNSIGEVEIFPTEAAYALVQGQVTPSGCTIGTGSVAVDGRVATCDCWTEDDGVWFATYGGVNYYEFPEDFIRA